MGSFCDHITGGSAAISDCGLVMPSDWSYEQAFSRNLGLISPAEQECLRRSRVAIPGMGGVGGIHLLTLARLGVGRFKIADADSFEAVNFNRQQGADITSLGRLKVEVMKQRAQNINPELEIDATRDQIGEHNVEKFLRGVDVVIDSIDFFSFDARRLLFRRARELGIWVITAAPLGFSTAWLVFDPAGMSFDRYFDMHDGMSTLDKLVAFAVGLAPRATHFPYIDLSYVDGRTGRGPSLGLACNLASAVAAAETAKILLRRGSVRPAPCFAQFDAYRCMFRRGRLRWGNRHPWQRLKRAILRKRLKNLGYQESCS